MPVGQRLGRHLGSQKMFGQKPRGKAKNGKEVFAAATTNYKEEVLFTINYRTDLTTACVVRCRDVLYDITRIDMYEGYKEDLTLFCSRRARQN